MLEKLLKVLSRVFAAENVNFYKENQVYRVDSVNIGDGRRVCTTRLNGNIRIFKVEPPYDSVIIFITTKNLGLYLRDKRAIFWRNIYQLGNIRKRHKKVDIFNFSEEDLF